MKNLSLPFFFLLVISTFVLVNCTPRVSTKRFAGDDYFVFSEGSRWEYRVKYVHPIAGVREAVQTHTIDGKEIIRENEYIRVVIIGYEPSRTTKSVSYYRKTNEGIYRIAGTNKAMPEHLTYRFPIEVGRSWTVNAPEGKRYHTVESIETVCLPENNYEDCVKICWEGSYKSRPYKGCTYKARGVGDVKLNYEIGGIKYEMILGQYVK